MSARAGTRPEAVVFDIGRVLIGWDPEAVYDRLLGPERRRALFAAVDLHSMNHGIDLGDDIDSTVPALAAAHPEYHDEILIWRDNWHEMAAPEIPRSVALLRALAARGVPVFALTNFGDRTFEIARGLYPFLDLFDRVFVSARLRMVKPDPAIYAHLEAETGVAPERLLFTDDRPENIAAAHARGWRAHLFEGPGGWAARLVAEGLLSEAEAAA